MIHDSDILPKIKKIFFNIQIIKDMCRKLTVHCILRQESKIIPSVKAVLAVLRLHTYIIVHLRGKNAARLLPIVLVKKALSA